MTVRVQLLLLALVAATSGVITTNLSAQNDEKNTGTKLDALLLERRDTLLARVEALEENYRAGNASFGMLISARTVTVTRDGTDDKLTLMT